MMSGIRLENITKQFEGSTAVNQLSLEIADGEFLVLVGPSGCGKSTLLRLLAGLEEVSDGRIMLDGNDISALPPRERNFSMIFQNYALFPHMTVLENVAYGLMVKGVGKKERQIRAMESLERVALGFTAARKPAFLSGGQRQRVALARALVNQPSVLLLDEPLGALDLKLREQMQGELKKLQRELGITFIFVTHDQSEALSMSDRVAVFNNGRIEQVDTPRELYLNPRTAFVAQFVGTANVLTADLSFKITGVSGSRSIRPEHIRLAPQPLADSQAVQVNAILKDIHFQGAATRYELALEGGERLFVSEPNNLAASAQHHFRQGQPVVACWDRDAMVTLLEG
ncbi:ABC transporter ATP-binding protein [Enterobacteriaceae bacterium ML5]|nr:ABC transporter ATP-binding protein [Enterobacteriaceae bacterium ML5]